MKKNNNLSYLKYFIISGLISIFFIFLILIIFLDTLCRANEIFCALIALIIQAPAHFISLIFGNNLSNQATTWLFRIITAFFWFLIGGAIGLIIYHARKK